MKINKEMSDGLNRYIKCFEKDPESHIRQLIIDNCETNDEYLE